MLSNLIAKTQLKHINAASPHNNFLTPDTIGISIFHRFRCDRPVQTT